ncbi:MAG: hypothetical protein IPG33_05350 [Betaproteobacteria bacterium]|nr:hypothetical protein [Betaproteobacteria bacterium]
MKLVFRKNEAGEISVFRKEAGMEKPFVYVEMIKELIESRLMDEPEVLGNFSDAERDSISSMTRFITEAIATAAK